MTRRFGAAPSSSGPASCSRPATRPRPTGSARRWADRRLAGCARRRSSFARGWTPTARRARRCSRCSTERRRSSRGCRSTRPSSTSAVCGGSRARPPRSPFDFARDVLETVGLPVTVGVARTKFLAKVASGVAKPDGLLVVPDRRRAGFPAPASGRAAVGRRTGHRRPSSASGPSPPWRRSHDSVRRRWLGCSAERPAVTSTRSPTTGIPGGCRWAAVAARWGRSARSAADLGHPRTSTPTSSRWSTASREGCARLTACAAPSCCGSGSTTSRARRDRTRCRRRPRTPRRSSP